jgi:hypothetical protein
MAEHYSKNGLVHCSNEKIIEFSKIAEQYSKMAEHYGKNG